MALESPGSGRWPNSGRGDMLHPGYMIVSRRRRAFTLLEVLIGLAISAVLMGVVYGLFHLFFWSRSRSNIIGLTRRSSIQKDAKSGIRRLTYRLREAIQILTPAAGTSASELTFRDISNNDVRIIYLPAEKLVVSERDNAGTWVRETDPETVSTPSGPALVSWPVKVINCTAIRFTVLSGSCVTIQASLENEGAVGSLLTVVKLRNAGKAGQ